jgi:hypothetical protein
MTAVIASSFSLLAAGSTVPAEEAENVRPRDRLRRGPLALSTCAGIGPRYDYRLNALVMQETVSGERVELEPTIRVGVSALALLAGLNTQNYLRVSLARAC